MNPEATKTIHDNTRLAFEGRITFPEVVKQLINVGVERYYADLVALEKIFYFRDGVIHRIPLPLEDAPAVAHNFSEENVISALRSVQRSETIYPDFLRGVMNAGCAAYTVFIDGKQVHYFGRKGELYIEKFPPAP